MKSFFLLAFLIGLNTVTTFAQTPTVGLTKSSSLASEGYSLYTAEGTQTAVLIDNCGRVVNQWQLNNTPGLTCYLLENGNLLFAGKDSLEIRDWNDNQLWSYATTANGIRQHHDIEPLPNGNILCIVTELKTDVELTDAGRDSALLTGNFKIDKIVELQPVGVDSAIIVWEWAFWDHLVQDFDSAKPNYDVVADHPELIDFNYDMGYNSDWSHLNSIDYNADLDQILVSARHRNEIYIIDHSTTTSEAAGHTGGNAGKGGDILWRWGNPEVYGQVGSGTDRLYLQHDAKWIVNIPGYAGQISVFNNGGDGTSSYSAVHRISPSLNGFNYSMSSAKFEPTSYEYSWLGSNSSPAFYGSKKCGVQWLPNQNFIICNTDKGTFSEFTESGDSVWNYVNPIYPGGIFSQFDIPSPLVNSVFRIERYPSNYLGVLSETSTATIENMNSISDSCLTLTIDLLPEISFTFVNPVVEGQLIVETDFPNGTLELISMQGKTLRSWQLSTSNSLEVSKFLSGIYLLRYRLGTKEVIKRVAL